MKNVIIGVLLIVLAAGAWWRFVLHDGTPENSSLIQVVTATYGMECGRNQEGNSTSFVRLVCDGKEECTYSDPGARVGDKCAGTPKSFDAIYTCTNKSGSRTLHVPPEDANRAVVLLSCRK